MIPSGLTLLEPVFFSQKVDAAIAGKDEDAALSDLLALIQEAILDKEAGYGPPQEEINLARRKWLDLYEAIYSGRIAA